MSTEECRGDDRPLQVVKEDQEEEGDIQLTEAELPMRCEECGIHKKDIIMKPCNHFEFCFQCLNKEINFSLEQTCPTCNKVCLYFKQQITGVLVVEQIIASTNFKVLQEYVIKQDIGAAQTSVPVPEGSPSVPNEIPFTLKLPVRTKKEVSNSEN